LEFRRHTLKNGLELVAECDAEAYSSALGFFVRSGSRDETDGVAGVSHFLEHMAFKGTSSRTADDVNREFDELGAHYNAFTNEEATVFYAAVIPECLERAVDLLGDILRPSLREEDFDTEKQVILEEIRMYDDQPPFGADEKVKALHYGPHPLGRSVLGTAASITALRVEQMRAYFQSRYSPGNIVVAAAGALDFEALIRAVERCCGAWEPFPVERVVTRPQFYDGYEVMRKESATQQYALQLAPAPAAEDEDRFAAKLAATILGDDSGSRLYWELIDPGLAEQASVSHYEYEGAGAFMTYMSCEPEEAAENIERMHDLFRRAESGGFTAAELNQAKNKIRSRIVLSAERPRGRMFVVGSDWVHRREYRSVDDDLKTVAAITLDELHAVLAAYPITRATTVTIGPLAELPAAK
jgi:predicted Zn-dependent peptidase